MNFNKYFDYLRPRSGEMLGAVESLVVHESPSRDKPALDALAGRLAGRFGAIGLDVERLPNPTGGDHLRMRLGDPADARSPALVLCHYDTVWKVGTLAKMPFRVEGGRAYGPGVYDMKSSLVLVEYALRALRSLATRPPRPVVALFTSDEEIGSPTSRALIEGQARASAYVLVMEPPLPGGGLKTARKGVGHFTLEIEGRAAHAGVEPENGVSAIVELAHQVLALERIADPASGTTVNVGLVSGGTTPNVVPAAAVAIIDARATTLDEARRFEDALLALRPALKGSRLRVRGAFSRPPMERTPQSIDLYDRARAIGQTLGLDLTEGSTGGGSDGNFTAALGLPTLDGLGMPGAGAHAEDEHILIDALPERAALLAALLMGL